MRIRMLSSLALVVALGTLAFAVTAQGAGADKVLVCHGTASDTNPYVLIKVSRNALKGHFDVQGGVPVGPGHGKQNAPDQWSELDGSSSGLYGSGFTGACLDLYNAAYGSGGPE